MLIVWLPSLAPSCACQPAPVHRPDALQAAVREYALSRALQLNPKSVPAWVALARLYAGE